MPTALNRPFSRVSFSRQFLLVSFLILLGGTVVIGLWLERQLEDSAANRAAAIAAVYVESILVAQPWIRSTVPAAGHDMQAALDRLFVDGPLRRKVVRFKLWRGDGSILYSSDHAQIGRRFPVEDLLAAAFGGAVQARLSVLEEPDNVFERSHWPRLLEVYVPVRPDADGAVVAVAEFYHSVENLGRDIRAAQMRGWLLVVVGAAAIYLLLLGLVRRASATLLIQSRELRAKISELHHALADNVGMRERLREAAAHTTTLNEQFLQRVAADIHDGPAQALALALLRFEELTGACSNCALSGRDVGYDLKTVHGALSSSLDELRTIAAGLRMPPGIEQLSLSDTARRAVRDFERKFAQTVEVDVDDAAADEAADEAPLAVKITVYRVIQEALANGCWHARGSAQQVRLRRVGGQVQVEVADYGPGFDPQAAPAGGRMGLAFMCERVRVLGGLFEIDSSHGHGTRVRARLPLSMDETVNA
ncbi:MAG: ATP-binding protein [Betaproteobacteria bacterium]|nr:ATP-binding protein [Betaproteobacteria bacterium]